MNHTVSDWLRQSGFCQGMQLILVRLYTGDAASYE